MYDKDHVFLCTLLLSLMSMGEQFHSSVYSNLENINLNTEEWVKFAESFTVIFKERQEDLSGTFRMYEQSIIYLYFMGGKHSKEFCQTFSAIYDNQQLIFQELKK